MMEMVVPSRKAVRGASFLGRSSAWMTTIGCLIAAASAASSGMDSSTLTASDILLKLFANTGGLKWNRQDNWLSLASSSFDGNVCSFHGVQCYNQSETDQSRIGMIQQIDLSDNHLVGTVPSEIFHLPYLESLIFRNNPDMDIILSGIAEAQFLLSFIISGTGVDSLQGLHNATSLQELHISNLRLPGPFPSEILALTALTSLRANTNAFTGPLPAEISNLQFLKELSLYDNELTGQIPTSIGQLAYLGVLNLGQNAFAGTLPPELGDCTTLQVVSVARDPTNEKGEGISGKLPSLANLVAIAALDLSDQRLTGSIPSDFLMNAPDQEVIKVDLTLNSITGTLPQALQQKSNLNLYLADNRISSLDSSYCSAVPGWLNGDVGSFGCNALLCPSGTSAPQGRATAGAECQSCSSAKYWGSTFCSITNQGVIDERGVLVDLYNKMDGHYWQNSQNWLDSSVSICQWYGVTCNGSNQVSALNLRNNGLSNTPPVQLYSLPQLSVLDFSSNSLQFRFDGIGNATKLEVLDLTLSDLTSISGIGALASTGIQRLAIGSNSLQGALPVGLFSLASLQELDISQNRFTGDLPSNIGQLTNLVRFRCFGNRLSGQIPTEVGALKDLKEFKSAGNQFTGTLPTELELMTNLQTLSLHQYTSVNSIGGSLLSFPNLRQLTSLELDGNGLTGTLPTDFLQNTLRSSDRIEVFLNDNKLSGSVPSTWASRFGNLFLDLSGNQISGFGSGVCSQGNWMDGMVASFSCDAILCPQGTYNDFGRQTSATGTCLSCSQAQFLGAKQCGSAPETETPVDILTKFYTSVQGINWLQDTGWTSTLDYCSWYGVGCNAAGFVVKLSLESNGLSGTPDPSLFRLAQLRELNLGNNSISFSFDGIGRLTNLTALILSGTGLNSVAGIEAAVTLTELNLADNDLQGTFPTEILQLTNLVTLLLDYNSIEGRIPGEIASLSSLEQLFMYSNRFTGPLPAALGKLSLLRTLSLSENSFSGTLPPELNDLINLEILGLQREGGSSAPSSGGQVGIDQGFSQDAGQGLTGPLLAFDKLTQIRKLYLGVNSLTGEIPQNFLDGVADKTVTIEIDLISNRLSGTIPPSLSRFDSLSIYLADNRISGIPEGICLQGNWMNGQASMFNCSAILCPPNTYSLYGRQANQNSACLACPSTTSSAYFGSFNCYNATDLAFNGEREILESLFAATDGEYWQFNDNWMDPEVHVCDWYGITCSSEQLVESIQLIQNGLSGSVPSSLYSLSQLRELNLGRNNIMVTFTGISRAQNLQSLHLDSISLTSLVGLDQAPILKFLDVSNNGLSSFPTELASLQTLEVLDLSGNDVEVGFESVANLGSLTSLSCSFCGLHGSIPSSLRSLVNLEYLILNENGFSGSLPSDILQLTNLRSLDLSAQLFGNGTSGLTGSLPSFDNFPQLSELRLSDNYIASDIPSSFLQIANPSGLKLIDLSRNNISGAIPVGLAKFSLLDIYLSGNVITGITPSLCSLSWNDGTNSSSDCDFILCPNGTFNGIGRATEKLPCEKCASAHFFGSTSCGTDLEQEVLNQLYLELGGPEWIRSDGWTSSEPICSWYGVTCWGDSNFVQKLSLPNNNLMTELNLEDNAIDVSFAKIGNAVTLSTLQLSQNRIKSIAGIGAAASSLSALYLSSNEVTGGLPAEVFQLSALQSLFLDHNQLADTIPSDIGSLRQLRELHLSSNFLFGQLPEEFSSLIFIRAISLGHNMFTGTLPRYIPNLPFLQYLALQNTVQDQSNPFAIVSAIVGDLPDFSRASQLTELYLNDHAFGSSIPSTFLAGVVNKTRTIQVDLSGNSIHGTIPETLSAFSDLRLFVADNLIDDIPNEICNKSTWMNGLLATGCDALLCSPGTYNQYGRRVSTEECQPCGYQGAALFYGATSCGPIFPQFLSDQEKLSELYASTDGGNWVNSQNWTTNSSFSPCDWYGVTCEIGSDGMYYVTRLSLPGNNLRGNFASIVFYLPNLTSLDISGNAVKMSMKDLGAAGSGLQMLNVASTGLSSVEGIGKVTSLQVLLMGRNTFSGQSIPDEMFKLSQIRELDIPYCGFTGTLSTAIGKLTKLQTFVASHNSFSGTIPTEIGRLTKMATLLLDENNFFGTLPTELETLKSLQSFSVAARTWKTAGLSGPLLSFSLMPSLRSLDLGSNSLTGSLPSNFISGISDVNSRVVVLLDSNLLVGEIPSSLTRLNRLNIDLSDNAITGVPSALCQKSSWWDGDVGRYQCAGLLCKPGTFSTTGRESDSGNRCEVCPGEEAATIWGKTSCASKAKADAKKILTLLFTETQGANWKSKDGWGDDSIDICNWYGVTCADNQFIESLILGGNNLVGTIPSVIFQLPGLQFLWLYSNPIEFSFDGIDKADSLTSLQLDSTGLKSLAGIGNAPALVDVDVRFNQLQGSLPTEIGKLSNLETLFCGNNQLSGTLPGFESNKQLSQLRAGGNKFSGSLPSFETLTFMRAIDLSDNSLDGSIPGTLMATADPTVPIFIDISGNALTGTIPSGLSRFSDLTIYARDNKLDGINQVLCDKKAWNGGDVAAFGCNAILCPSQTYNSIGRASQDQSQCLPCDQASWYGSSECNAASSKAYKLSASIVGALASVAIAATLSTL